MQKTRRQWAIERDRELVEEALDLDEVRVKRLPTWISVRCPDCRHSARIAIHLELVPRLKCSRCGHRNPIVGGREPLRTWAKYRR